jgi:hypothetical protein
MIGYTVVLRSLDCSECLATLQKIVWSADAKGPDHQVVPGYVDRLRLTQDEQYPYPTTHQAASEIGEFN